MFLLFAALHRFTPHFVNTVFGKLQIFSAAWMAHSHGSNDAQKTMGIIALALFTGTKAGSFDHLPGPLTFLRTPTFVLPVWVVTLCALTMAIGTAAGGWRIIRTLGHRMVKLQPVNGFAAETTAAVIIQAASCYGIPLSTTHVITASIMVVFPEPFGPRNPKIDPFPTENETRSTAVNGPKRFVSLSTSIIGSLTFSTGLTEVFSVSCALIRRYSTHFTFGK